MGVQPSLRQIGKYAVIDVIGTGGMGIVFRAHDPAIGRTVAIKMLKQSETGVTTDLFDRFFSREMKSTGNLNHKNIVTVYDSGEQDGNPYLVMEYLEGEPISKLIGEHRSMPLVEKLDLVIQVCDGLQYAHDRNVIHRDIKPANVILLADGTAKIVDFGVARIAGGGTSILQTGQLVGSLSYMSPEQINSLPIDARSDIFSLGVMLYELLTFELPFKGTDPASTFVKILREEPLPLSQFVRDIPPLMQTVMNRALAKNVHDRYQSAEEFSFDLLAVQRDLKAANIADYMKRAEAAMHRGDLERVRDHLLDVIRLDRQNERANRLLREVRRAIQQQQRSSQVIQMRSQAQVALAGAQYEEALACADQALRLDPTDVESVRLCEEIRNAISRAKAVREALNRAESALFAGDFDEAKEAVEESLRLDPSDSEARALASVVNKELTERSRRQRVQEFVDQARRGIAERKFNDALDALHHAEELDPADSNVRELLQWAQRGQEQEKRRRSLQEITGQIENALHEGDFSSACTISEMGLQRFPEEATLLRLRAISEKQREIAERRRFVQDRSLAVKVLSDQGKLAEAVQTLADALRKYPGEPNLESLLAITRDEIERQEIEREEAARQKEIQRAEAEARAQRTQQVLNWSIELRRLLDARADLDEITGISTQLRAAVEDRRIDEHAKEVASLVLSEVESRVRARNQAIAELDQLRRTIQQPQDAASTSEADNRLLSIKAAFPNERNIQGLCADLGSELARLRERRERAIASLTELAQAVDTTPSGELTALVQNAKQVASNFAADARVGALLQQVESSVSRRLERRAELLRDMQALLTDLSKVHSVVELNRAAERARSISALDKDDHELANRSKQVEAEAGSLREVMESLLGDMGALGERIAHALTVHEAEALVPQVRSLAENHAEFQDLQEAATRILAEVQGRRIEHELIVQELQASRSSIPQLQSNEDLGVAAARASQCRQLHRNDPTILTICKEIEGQVERILREKAELRERNQECDNAMGVAQERIHGGDLSGALAVLVAVEPRNPDRADLRDQIAAVKVAIEQERAEKERLDRERLDRERLEQERLETERLERERLERERQEQERIEQKRLAKEQAEAEARARRAAVEQAIQEARSLLSVQWRSEEALGRLRSALERDPESSELQLALESMQAEVSRQRAEEERLECERRERERLEQERLENERLEQERLEREHQEQERLEQERLERERQEQERLEQERIERKRIEKERAEAEERARKAAVEQAIREARELMLAQGRSEEAIVRLRTALDRAPESAELHSALESLQAEIARQRAEQERQEQERIEQERIERKRIEKEQAEAEERARKAAVEQAIREARELLLAQGRSEEAVGRLRSALGRDPESAELHSALESLQAEVARQRAEQEHLEKERLEQERVAREKAEAEERARQAELARLRAEQEQREKEKLERERLEQQRLEKERLERQKIEQERIAKDRADAEARAKQAAAEQAILQAQDLALTQGRSEDALRHLRSALVRDPKSRELQSALESMQTEVARQRAEQERLEQERLERRRLEQERLEIERIERERIARERAEAEARARKAAIEQAIQEARKLLLTQGNGAAALGRLRSALERDPESTELQSALTSMQAELARQRAEQERLQRERLERERLERERLEKERLEREKAEREARERQAAAQQAIAEAQKLLAAGQSKESLDRLQTALKRDPASLELRSAWKSLQEEVARQRAERERLERLERERIAIEKAEAETRTRQAAVQQAIEDAQKLLVQGRGKESLDRLQSALKREPASQLLQSTLNTMQAEVTRQRAEEERLERERLERARIEKERLERERLERERLEKEKIEKERLDRERLTKEKAEAEARARQAAAQQAIKEAREILAQGRGKESIDRLQTALKLDAASQELQAALKSVKAEAARHNFEQERLKKERAEAQARAQKEAAKRAKDEREEAAAAAQIAKTTHAAKTLQAAPTTRETTESPQAGRPRWIYISIALGAILAISSIAYFVSPGSRSTSEMQVRLVTDPSDGTLTIDGKATNCPGSCIAPLSQGKHTITLQKPGYLPQTVVAGEGSDREFHLKLEPIGAVTTPSSSLAIVADLGMGAVLLDGRQVNDSSLKRRDLNDLAPGSHHVVVTQNNKTLELSLHVSLQGAVSVEGATGLDQDVIVAVTHAGDYEDIFCRCSGAELQLNGKKVKASGRDRYKIPNQGGSEYELRLSRNGQSVPIRLQGADSRHGMALIESLTPGSSSPTQVVIPARLVLNPPTPSNAPIAQTQPAPAAQVRMAEPPPPAPSSPTPASTPKTATPTPEVTAWNNVKDSRDLNALRDFRSRFPSSPNFRSAYEKMEEISWDSTRKSAQQSDFQQFLKEYPDSPHESEANQRLAAISTSQQQQMDRELVSQALETYRSAYERKDLNGLTAIWLGVPAPRFKLTFQAADKIHVMLAPSNLTINGEMATVSCRQRVELVIHGKTVSANDATVQFTLRKSQGKWVIESVK